VSCAVNPCEAVTGQSVPGTLVTVVIPCYNGAYYLAEAIRSGLTQTHPSVEVLVIDDGSTDESPEIAQGYPVRYIRQENRGLSGARNTGIAHSRGRYLVFLDADDRLLPDAIASGLRALNEHPECVIAVAGHAFISAGGMRLRTAGKEHAGRSPYEALLRSNFIEMISSVIFRRSIFEEVGQFNPALRAAEDYDLYLRIARAHPICCHSAVVAEYRMHDENMSRNSALMLTTTLHVLRTQQSYLGNDVKRRSAFRAGMRTWRKQYGRRLAAELAGCHALMSVDCLGYKLRTLALRYPQGLLLFLLLRLHPGRQLTLFRREPVESHPSAGNVMRLGRALLAFAQRH
jgi:glycosyltransferase involved in cell wall biosynthesis